MNRRVDKGRLLSLGLWEHSDSNNIYLFMLGRGFRPRFLRGEEAAGGKTTNRGKRDYSMMNIVFCSMNRRVDTDRFASHSPF